MDNWRCSHGWLRGEQCEICNAPKREWIGLTDEEIDSCWYQSGGVTPGFARSIEAKLKERNNG